MNRQIGCLFLTLIVISFGCKGQEGTVVEKDNIVYADSLKALSLITFNDRDGFFDHITALDASIQMKEEKGFDDRSLAVETYKSFLKKEVEDFEDVEIEYMNEVFDTVNQRLRSLNPDLIIPEIQLVKIKLNHYGPDVYYTRGNSIMLPKNSLKGRSTKGQINVMLHEVWHILSRNNPELKEEVYKLIGFTKADKKIKIPSQLQSRLLTNPDGVNMEYVIQLSDDVSAIPLIKSTQSKYTSNNPAFFNYLKFDLYEIDVKGNVKINEQGGTTLDNALMSTFFKKIKDNTQYIIHPDEIVADNFMLAVNAFHSEDYENFSSQGLPLIHSIIDVLQKYER